MKRPQAKLVDPVQAMRVRLAIQWGVAPSEVSVQRARESIEEQLHKEGEDVVMWQ